MSRPMSEPFGARGHVWLTGPTQADRAALLAELDLPGPVPAPLSAHRQLRGPYTGAGALLTDLVMQALDRRPDLVAAHEVEILSVVPDLRDAIPATTQTLTTIAVPEERTRLYAGLRTLRLAHGITEFLRDYLQAVQDRPRVIVLEDLHHADRTDQELVAVLLRRIDPRLLSIVVGTDRHAQDEVDEPQGPVSGPGDLAFRPPDGGLFAALARYCRRVDAAPVAATRPVPAQQLDELAERYVAGDCISDDPAQLAAYSGLSESRRRALHDARATHLRQAGRPSTARGALPLHLDRGTADLEDTTTVIGKAIVDFVDAGYYEAAIEFCEWGRTMVTWQDQPAMRWLYSSKLFTALAAVGRGEEAEVICDESRANSTDPLVHRQLAYATAMIHTRHLAPHRRDHDRALGWINEAIAISSLFTDPRKRAFGVVFNENGRALIEAHRGRPEVALELVTAGLTTLDSVLEPGEHLLHRSVLRYNRAQVLVMMRRLEEALEEYRSVIELDPYYPEYHLEVANVLHRLGRDGESITAYDEAIRLGPPFPEVHYNRADVLAGLGDVEAAIAGFGYVLELEPRYLDAYVNRAGLLADLGHIDEAGQDIAAGLALEPGNVHLLSLRGRLALEDGRLADARADLDRALDSDPGLAGAWALRGAVNFEDGDLAGALADLSRAIDLGPDAAVLFNRGTVYQAMGDWAAARDDFDQVLAQDPDEADAWLHRAQCRAELGDHGGSDADARAFLRLAPERAGEAAALLQAGNRPAVGAGVGPA